MIMMDDDSDVYNYDDSDIYNYDNDDALCNEMISRNTLYIVYCRLLRCDSSYVATYFIRYHLIGSYPTKLDLKRWRDIGDVECRLVIGCDWWCDTDDDDN